MRSELLDPALDYGHVAKHPSDHFLAVPGQQYYTAGLHRRVLTAAAIAGTGPMRTGLTVWKLAKGLYIVPLLFAFTPLVAGNWTERLTVFGFSCFGLYALAGVLQWHLESNLNPATGALAITSAVCLLWTPFGLSLHTAGALMLIGVVVWQKTGQSRRPIST